MITSILPWTCLPAEVRSQLQAVQTDVLRQFDPEYTVLCRYTEAFGGELPDDPANLLLCSVPGGLAAGPLTQP